MTKEQDEAKALMSSIQKRQKKDFWVWLANTPVGLLVKALKVVYVGLSMLILSVFAAYAGHVGKVNINTLMQWTLSLAAAPIFVIAAVMLGKFLIKAARD
jgi:hypothetical protein